MGNRKTTRSGSFWKSSDSSGRGVLLGKKGWGSSHAHIAKDGSWGHVSNTPKRVKSVISSSSANKHITGRI